MPNKTQDPVEYGHQAALENHKAERANSDSVDTNPLEEILEEGHETARVNHAAEQEHLHATGTEDLANDTSKKAKVATAKSQLDPNGDDPISSKEVSDSATDASMETGNKTSVSNEEAADRAHNPENTDVEDAPRTTLGETTDPHNETSEKVSEASTSNRKDVRKALEAQDEATTEGNKS